MKDQNKLEQELRLKKIFEDKIMEVAVSALQEIKKRLRIDSKEEIPFKGSGRL